MRILLILVVMLCALPVQAKCKSNERFVFGQTAILGGPGLGFETIKLLEKAGCFPVLQTSPDGSFVLVQLESQNAGWIASGLVDAELSTPEDDKEILSVSSTQRVLSRETALRASPRFDADATTIAPANSILKVLATSADGQWLRVSSKGKDGTHEGWVVRFATSEKQIESGAEPSAGTGAWAVANVPNAAKPAPLQSKKIPPKTSAVGTGGPDGVVKNSNPKEEMTDPAIPVLGRTSTVYAGLTANTWIEQYRSDAVGDPYHAYDLQSLGGGFYAGYSMRSNSNPFVLDVRLTTSLNPFSAFEPGALDPITIFTGQGGLSTFVGWRVHEKADVDVDMGMTPSINGILNPGFGVESEASGAFASSLYFDLITPTVVARSRMDGAGMLVLEATAVVGAMTFFGDPGAAYQDAPAADKPPLPIIGQPVTPNVAGEVDAAAPIHLVVGANGRIRYVYPLTDSLLLDVGATFGLRQTVINGPGLRTGSYLSANNLDLSGVVFAGATFGL